jgi:TolA-binding protein
MLFEAGEPRAARAHLRVLMDAGGPEAEEATFYYAVSFFRQGDWARTTREFKRLIGRFPNSRMLAAAHWHIAISDLRRGRVRRGRERFAYLIRRFPNDPTTVANSRAELTRLERRNEGLLVRWWRRIY